MLARAERRARKRRERDLHGGVTPVTSGIAISSRPQRPGNRRHLSVGARLGWFLNIANRIGADTAGNQFNFTANVGVHY